MATKKEKNEEQRVAKVVQDFSRHWEYVQGSYHSTWQDCWKLYNNQRVEVGYEGITNTFVPMTFSTIETMVSALANGKPKFNFVATKPGQEQNTDSLNQLLDYYWDCDKWSMKVAVWLRNCLMYGTGVMHIYWDIDKPRLINVPLRDFFVDPKASGLNDAQYSGRRFLTTKSQLEEVQVVDIETSELVTRYKNLDKVTAGVGDAGDITDKENKDMFLGSTLSDSAKKEQIEVIEYWTTDRVYSVANRSVMIEDKENPYRVRSLEMKESNPKGLIPFVVQRNYYDESLFYGKGEIEPIKQSQELLNDLTNQNIDAITYILNPMYTLDPKYADQIDKVENLPGAVYPFEAGTLVPIPMGSIPNDAFQERLNIKTEIREVTAASEIAKGTGQDAGKITATEVNAQLAQAGQRFQIKVTQMENDGYNELGKLVFRMIKLFIEAPQEVPTQGKEEVIFDPVTFVGEYEPRVQLDITSQRMKQETQEQYSTMFASMVSNPLVNQEELTRLYLEKVTDLETDEIERLLQPNPMMGMESDPMMQGQDPMMQQGMQPPMEAPLGL